MATAWLVIRNLARITIQLKRRIGVIHVECTQISTFFYDFEATQNTGKHTVNLSIAQDFEGNEYIHNSIEEFWKGFINDKFKGYTLIAHNAQGYDC